MPQKEFQKLYKRFPAVRFFSSVCIVFVYMYIIFGDRAWILLRMRTTDVYHVISIADASHYSVYVHKSCLAWRLSSPCRCCCCCHAVFSPRSCTNRAESPRVSRRYNVSLVDPDSVIVFEYKCLYEYCNTTSEGHRSILWPIASYDHMLLVSQARPFLFHVFSVSARGGRAWLAKLRDKKFGYCERSTTAVK